MSGLDLTVGWPLALWALMAAPMLFLLAWRSRFALSRARLLSATAVRASALILIALAVADVRIGWPTERLAVTMVLDGSQAITSAERRTLGAELAQMAASQPDVTTRLVGDAQPVDAPTAVGAAVATLPEDRVRRILLATDGRDEDGRLAAAVAAARQSGATVSVMGLGSSPPIDSLGIAAVDAPRLVRAEETLDVEVAVHTAGSRSASLAITIDGNEVARGSAPIEGERGVIRTPVRFPDTPGVHRLEVQLVGEAGAVSANDRWSTLVEVLPKPRVRIYHEAGRPEPALARVLRDAGMEVDIATPQAAFTNLAAYEPYSVVFANEVDLGDFSEPQQQAMRRWVEEQGGGLVTITGNHPIRRTPRALREIEPLQPPPAIPEPRPLELVLVIDRSSSMSGMAMEQAKRAGVAAVRSLRRDARVGLVTFSGGVDRAMTPVPVDQADVIVQAIQGTHASGGTNIAAAISAANRVMSTDPRYIHHVILVSDGESDPQSAIAAAMALAGRGVSISTITIGSYSTLLAEIARIGRGRYHTTSASGLASLVVSEAQYRQPPAHRQGSFTARERTHLSMLDGVSLEGAPPITGYALSSARSGATVALTGGDSMPLLAHWHRGLGQVMTYTSSTDHSWADSFRQWEGFRALWGAVARGMQRPRTVEPPRVAVTEDPEDPSARIVTVISPWAQMEPIPIARLFRGAGREEPLELAPVGPGTFQARVPLGDGFIVDARSPADPEPTAAAGDESPVPPSLRRFGMDPAGLASLAAIGGGVVVTQPLEIMATPSEAVAVRFPLRTPLLLVALGLYLLSLLLLRLPDRRLRVATATERPSRIPQPARGRPRISPDAAGSSDKEKAA